MVLHIIIQYVIFSQELIIILDKTNFRLYKEL